MRRAHGQAVSRARVLCVPSAKPIRLKRCRGLTLEYETMIAAFGRAILCFGRTAASQKRTVLFSSHVVQRFRGARCNEIWTEGPIEPNADDPAADQEATAGASAPQQGAGPRAESAEAGRLHPRLYDDA